MSTLLPGQHLALITQSIIGRRFVANDQIELSWPLRTPTAEMPHLVTCVCTVFHGKVAFPFLSSSTRKVYFAASLSQGGCSGFLSDAEILRLVGSGDAGHELDAFWAQFEKRRRLVEPNDVARRLGPLRARGAKMPKFAACLGAVLHRNASCTVLLEPLLR